jgi:hypothetical protein
LDLAPTFVDQKLMKLAVPDTFTTLPISNI